MPTPPVHDYGTDIYTEAEGDEDTLANLGPLRALAGIWTSAEGADVHPVGAGSDVSGPVVDGSEHNPFVERYELHPTDPQTNGPQLLYGLRYHTHIVKPGEVETFHDQVGYWLWEPAARRVLHTIAIPRGQVLLASGPAEPDATTFEVRATLGSETFGILSNPFLDPAFRTEAFRMPLTVEQGGRGLPRQAANVVRQTFADVAALRPPGGLGLLMAAPTILTHGTPDQVARLVPPILDGQQNWCQLFSEPGAGSDLAGLTTRAERDGDRWIINGQKVWSSMAMRCDHGMLLARTDFSVPKHAGISWFAFALDQPGVTVRALKQVSGAP